MNLICEPLETSDQDYFLVGDLYHWELGKDGYFTVEKNSDESPDNMAGNYFETLNVEAITQNIQD